MTPLTVLVGGKTRFIAVIFDEDSTTDQRLWVCLRGEGSPSQAAWAGCWSKSGPVAGSELGRLLVMLDEKITTGGKVGPYGPYLDDHYFFDGWDYWGGGVPAPIAHESAEELLSRARWMSSRDEAVEAVTRDVR